MTPAKGGQMSDETKQPEFTSGSCSAPCDHMSLSELAETLAGRSHQGRAVMIRSGRDTEQLAYTYTARLDGIDTGEAGEFASHARLRTCRGYRRVPLTGHAATKAKEHVGGQVDLHCEGAVCVLVTPVAVNAGGW